MKWLVIYIAAPLASYGEAPGNARRGSADRPTRSALLGLAGAALGIERADQRRQNALFASFMTATRTLAPGTPLTDFHTFQSLPEGAGRASTRADALARRSDLETSITRRDYRADGRWQAAYVAVEEAAVTLEDLCAAFLRPHFALWVGRKSCPLAHPLAPRIVEADDVASAFHAHEEAAKLKLSGGGAVAIDARLKSVAGANASRSHRRRDDPGDRLRWHFGEREEIVFHMEER